MVSLVTATQLADRLQITLDAETAALAVNGASGMVRSIGRQTYSFVSQETIDLIGGGRILTLPERPAVVDGSNPLTVVEAAYFGAQALTLTAGTDFERVGNELTRGWPWWWGNSSRLMGWPYILPRGVWAPKVTVTYSHGYATVPDDIQKITLDIASALYSNPEGLRSHGIDDFNETYAAEVLGAVTVEGIRKQLTAVGRRRGATSVRLS